MQDNSTDYDMVAAYAHPLVKMLIARINVLLIDLAENEDPMRKSLHDLSEKIEKIKGLGTRFIHSQKEQVTTQTLSENTLKIATRDMELLSSKKHIMKDMIKLIEALEESVDVLRNNTNEVN